MRFEDDDDDNDRNNDDGDDGFVNYDVGVNDND